MNRLNEILSLVQKVDCTADVGCDHGILSKMILASGLSNTIIASDISAPSLNKAKELLQANGLLSRAKFFVQDGLNSQIHIDQALICGMGGMEIIKILDNYFKATANRPILVLQPMKNLPEVRCFLVQNHYKITVDKVIQDDKYYWLILAVFDENCAQNLISQKQYYLGTDMSQYKNEIYQTWLLQQKQKLDNFVDKIPDNYVGAGSICVKNKDKSFYKQLLSWYNDNIIKKE